MLPSSSGSPDKCLSNREPLWVATTPSDSNLLEIPRKALKNVQAIVSELVSSMRDPSNADVRRVWQLCNQKLLPETRENWQPAVASARASINAQIEGYAASEAFIKLLHETFEINVGTHSRQSDKSGLPLGEKVHTRIIDALTSAAGKHETSRRQLFALEWSLLSVLAQRYYRIPQSKPINGGQAAPVICNLDSAHAKRLETDYDLNGDPTFRALKKVCRLIQGFIYKREPTSEDAQSSEVEQGETQITTPEAKALVAFLKGARALRDVNALSDQCAVLDKIEEALSANTTKPAAKRNAPCGEGMRLRIDSPPPEKRQRRQDETSLVQQGGGPPKKRLLQRANKRNKLKFVNRAAINAPPAMSAILVPKTGPVGLSNETLPKKYPTAPWLNPLRPAEIARTHAPRKPKLKTIYSTEMFINNAKLDFAMRKAITAFYAHSYADQDRITRRLVSVEKVGDDVLLEGANEALRGQFGGVAARDIVVKPNSALCLGFYRGVLIESAEQQAAYIQNNPQSAESVEQYGFKLAFDDGYEQRQPEGGVDPFIMPVLDGKKGRDIIGVLPYINTYTEQGPDGRVRTCRARVNVQPVVAQTKVGLKNKVFDLVAYVIANDSDEPLQLKAGDPLFVDYGQNFVDCLLSNNSSLVHNARFPLHYMDQNGVIHSHETLSNGGDYSLTLIEDRAVVAEQQVTYIARALNRPNAQNLNWHSIKQFAEQQLNSSEHDRLKFLESKVGVMMDGAREVISAKQEIKQGESFILPGFSYRAKDSALAAKAVSTPENPITEAALDEDSFELDLLGDRATAKQNISALLKRNVYLSKDAARFVNRKGEIDQKAERVYSRYKYFFAACGEYRSFLVDVPDTEDTELGNIGVSAARSNVAELHEPPDTIIFYAIRDIRAGEPLMRLVGI